jgi:putative copper resistance protein D
MHARISRPAAVGAFALALTPVLGHAAAGPAAAHGELPAEPPTLASLSLGWSVEPVLVLGLAAALLAWRWILGRVRRRHPAQPVARARTVAFAGGLAAIALALLGGVERYDTALFSVHMVQHLLLVVVAAPLIALAAPVTQLLRAVSPADRSRLLRVLHSRPVAALGHPVTAWLVFTGVLWASHFSPLFDAALEDPLLHDLEHVLFLCAGLLFWWPAVALDPAPRRLGHAGRLLYLATQMPQNSFLAMAILFAPAPLYPHYVTLGSPWGIDALADQRLAAGIMWLIGDAAFLVALLVVFAAWQRREARDAAADDRRADAARAELARRADALAARRAPAAQPDVDGGAGGSGEASSSR